ncbi:MAG: hypothetical protein Q8940_14335, partial [Bacteroidota bacterium]|nr:hypothetical protein [Bacteroidota bacterium]
MQNFLKLTLKAIFILLLCTNVFAQPKVVGFQPSKDRGDPKARAKGNIQGNNINTTVQNFGMTGRWGAVPFQEQTPYEWPKNSGEMYLAMEGLWVGGEVYDKNGKLQHIVDVYNGRQSPEGKTWNFEPVPGYLNSRRPTPEVATDIDPTTWPDFWPDRMSDETDPGWKGKWNGYFGKGIRNADQEMFYRVSDDRYARFEYFPDSTDLTRRGLGIIFDTRVLAWSQVLVQDVLYILQYVKNDGTKDINKAAVTIWWADFVGGNAGAQDNISEFDRQNAIAWSRDRDNRSADFGSDP